ncbi:MAG: hypothetical protein LBB14_02480, partial [Puniceicoccales bacterium]|nr:hypothetical protein [Puniceicoccales bacterium]
MTNTVGNYGGGSVFSSPQDLLELTKELGNPVDRPAKEELSDIFTRIFNRVDALAGGDAHIGHLRNLLKLISNCIAHPLMQREARVEGKFILLRRSFGDYRLYSKADNSNAVLADADSAAHSNGDLRAIVAPSYQKFIDNDGHGDAKLASLMDAIASAGGAEVRAAVENVWTGALGEVLSDRIGVHSATAFADPNDPTAEEQAKFLATKRLYDAFIARAERPSSGSQIREKAKEIRELWMADGVHPKFAICMEKSSPQSVDLARASTSKALTAGAPLSVALHDGQGANKFSKTGGGEFFKKVFSGSKADVSDTFGQLSAIFEEDLCKANSALRKEKERDFARYLKMTLFGQTNAAGTRNKFDWAIDDQTIIVSLTTIVSIASGFRQVEHCFSAQEAALFRAKLQLLAAKNDAYYVPNFQEFEIFFGKGENLGSSNETLRNTVVKTWEQINDMRPRSPGALKFKMKREGDGSVACEFPAAVNDAVADAIIDKLSGAISSPDQQWGGRRWGNEPPPEWNVTVIPGRDWKLSDKKRWIGEIITSGIDICGTYEDLATAGIAIPLDASINSTIERAVLHIYLASMHVPQVEKLDMFGSSPEYWKAVPNRNLASPVAPYHSHYTTRYSEEHNSDWEAYFHPRSLGLYSLIQDVRQDMFMLKSYNGAPSGKFNSLIAQVKRFCFTDNRGTIGDNPIAREWNDHQPEMTKLVRALWNAGCKEFGLLYHNEKPDGSLGENVMEARKVNANGVPDIEALANLIELLRAIEEPYVQTLRKADYRTVYAVGVTNANLRGILLKDLYEKTTFGQQEAFLRKYLHDNIDFTGKIKDGFTSEYGTFPGEPKKENCFRLARIGQGIALTFQQQLALHRTQILLSTSIMEFATLPCSEAQGCLFTEAFTGLHDRDRGTLFDALRLCDENGIFKNTNDG